MFILVIFYVHISFKIQRHYMNLKREVTRLKSISSSPIIQQFKEAIEGVTTIRVFGKYDEVFEEYLEKVNDYQRNLVTSTGATQWFNIRIAMLAMTVTLPIVCFSVKIQIFLRNF